MKNKQILTSMLVSGACLANMSVIAQLLPGNLAVLRVGDGTQPLANTGNTGFIDQFSKAGSLVNSIRIPDTGAGSIIFSGTATSEGALNLSSDSKVLLFGGYNTPQPYTSSVSGTVGTLVARAVGVVSPNGTVTVGATSSTAYSGNNIRSVAGSSTDYYGAGGGTSGTYYFGTSQPAGAIQTATGNTRFVDIVNGSLYYVTGSGTSGLYKFNGVPTGADTPVFVTGTSTSPYEFSMNPAGNLIYITDDSATAVGGIKRYDFSGGVWTLTYTLGTGVANIGARGLAVDYSGANPVIYATTAEASLNRLIGISDTGAASTATTLSTSIANEIYRGVDFTPSVAAVPEPSTYVFAGAGLLAYVTFRRRKY